MLILTRKTGESIMIGDDIAITVLRVMGDTVKIGIEAPRSIPIYREEIYCQRARDADRKSSTEPTATIEQKPYPKDGNHWWRSR